MLDPQKRKWGKRDESIGDLHVHLHLGFNVSFLELLWEMLRGFVLRAYLSSSGSISLSEYDVWIQNLDTSSCQIVLRYQDGYDSIRTTKTLL